MSIAKNGLVAGGLLFSAIGCAEQAPAVHETTTQSEDVIAHPGSEIVRPGSSLLIASITDQEDRDKFVSEMTLVEHQYPHGLEDENAPTITDMPIRIDGHVSTTGKEDIFNNDLACDTINVDLDGFEDPASVYVGALALSDQENDQVLVSWPKNADDSVDRLYVCFDDGNEPSGGVVLVASDQPR